MPEIRTAPTARVDFPVVERRDERCSHLRWLLRRESLLGALGALKQCKPIWFGKICNGAPPLGARKEETARRPGAEPGFDPSI